MEVSIFKWRTVDYKFSFINFKSLIEKLYFTSLQTLACLHNPNFSGRHAKHVVNLHYGIFFVQFVCPGLSSLLIKTSCHHVWVDLVNYSLSKSPLYFSWLVMPYFQETSSLARSLHKHTCIEACLCKYITENRASDILRCCEFA